MKKRKGNKQRRNQKRTEKQNAHKKKKQTRRVPHVRRNDGAPPELLAKWLGFPGDLFNGK